jgi:hypothetical protein
MNRSDSTVSTSVRGSGTGIEATEGEVRFEVAQRGPSYSPAPPRTSRTKLVMRTASPWGPRPLG